MGRVEDITRHLKRYDPKLYCEKSREGKLCVYRKSQRIESYEYEGVNLLYSRPTPFFIFALTDNWKASGEACDWGIEPILKRVKEIDLWNRNLAEECIQEIEKEQEILAKDRRNDHEAFLKDFRRGFAKTFNDVNVASLEKIDKRKTGEKNGNY